MKSKTHRLFVVAFAPILFLASPAAFATAGTWNYDGSTAASNSWATAGSWSVGLPNAVGDTANFTFNLASANRTITTDGIKTVGTLNIGDPTSTYYTYTLSTGTAGSYLILDQTGVANTAINFSTAASTAANTVSVPIVLNDNVVITSSVTAQHQPDPDVQRHHFRWLGHRVFRDQERRRPHHLQRRQHLPWRHHHQRGKDHRQQRGVIRDQ